MKMLGKCFYAFPLGVGMLLWRKNLPSTCVRSQWQANRPGISVDRQKSIKDSSVNTTRNLSRMISVASTISGKSCSAIAANSTRSGVKFLPANVVNAQCDSSNSPRSENRPAPRPRPPCLRAQVHRAPVAYSLQIWRSARGVRRRANESCAQQRAQRFAHDLFFAHRQFLRHLNHWNCHPATSNYLFTPASSIASMIL